MSELGEGLGTAVGGGLFAHAIDSRADGNALPDQPLHAGHFAENACLNCGTTLQGSHCHNCGQPAHLHRTLGAFAHDLLHGALHLEGRTWRTLPKLALKPGELTRRYIEGERARFVSPMALFLFSIFLMFAIFQAIGLTTPTDLDPAAGARQGLEFAEQQVLAERTEARAQLDALSADDPARTGLETRIAETEIDLADIRRGENFVVDDARSSVRFGTGRTGVGFVDIGLEKWQSNPGLMLYKLQANGYKFSWLLIPISIPFVWLLFVWKRRFRAYDHAIFVTYSIAFMSLFFIALSLLIKAGAPEWFWSLLVCFVPPIHLYKQLRGAYALSRISAFWRLAVLLVFITVVATLFLQLILVIGTF